VNALIGHTGFVGSTLARLHTFDACFNRSNLEALAAGHDLVVCAGAPGTKWIANQDPAGDRAAIDRLECALDRLGQTRMILISTVDVFATPYDVDEDSVPEPTQPYGRHRLELERFVRARFPDATIARLPALVGPGLRKNALYDLCHDHAVDRLDARAVFQVYPVERLWRDLQGAPPLIHLVAEPLALGDIARVAFGRTLAEGVGTPARYDVRSLHKPPVSTAESLAAITRYARTEPR
jgi:hypothetical protein